MKAMINGTVIAEATADDVISIEGNSYFPPGSLADGVLTQSATPYTCPWKGQRSTGTCALPRAPSLTAPGVTRT